MIRFLYIIFFCTVGVLLFTNISFAISNDFTITIAVGDDLTPPTIPDPVNITFVTYSQIDVSWGASTDDENLSGYRLFRDGVHIATTSLTTYSDTGLAASTTYTYSVEAYDWLRNISTTSVSVSTTTLSIRDTPPIARDYGTRLQLRLFDFSVDSLQTSVDISWVTNQYAQYSLRWGKESVYDLGFVHNDTFRKKHRTIISDLEPGTSYMYELIGYNQQGVEFVLSSDSFTTKTAPDVTAPSNVSKLRAVVEGDSIKLFWSNPLDSDFAKVRIVRNNIFYPRDPSGGYIAYQGLQESMFDSGALRSYGIQYYTIFSYDESGNISSGAVIAVGRNGDAGKDYGTTKDGEQSATSSVADIEYADIDFSDVLVLQDGVLLDSSTDSTVIDRTIPIVLQIPYDLLPEHLKTILVTVTGRQIDEASYMLRVNADKSAYQAVIPPLTHLGEYTLSFSIYDYQTELLSSFQGRLLSAEMTITKQFVQKMFSNAIGMRTIIFGFLFLFLVFAILFYIILAQKRVVNEDKLLGEDD